MNSEPEQKRPRRPSALDGNQIYDLLEQYSNWHRNHPDAKLSQDFQDGFIAGLQQAQILIDSAEAKLKNELTTFLQRTVDAVGTRTPRRPAQTPPPFKQLAARQQPRGNRRR